MSRFPVAVPRGPRLPPVVDEYDSLHVFGDTHFEVPDTYYTQSNTQVAKHDFETMIARHSVLAWGQAGDQTTMAREVDIAAFVTWWSSLSKDNKPSAIVPGNHEILGQSRPLSARDLWTPTQWATRMASCGVPSKDYIIDVGANLRIICLSPMDDDLTSPPMTYRLTLDSTQLTWCDQQIKSTARNCVVLFHAPLKDTVNSGAQTNAGQLSSSDPNWYAHDTSAYRIADLVADNPNLKAWISGHTHSPTFASKMATKVTYGGVSIAAINSSSLHAVSVELNKPSIVSCRISVTSNNVIVRYRDHGAKQWLDPVYSIDV